MLVKRIYSPSEIKKITDSLVILIDTREKKVNHITNYFDRENIRYESMKLDYADFSFYVPRFPVLGIIQDVYFDKKIAIERKANLDELVGNLTKDDGARLERELIRSGSAKLSLMIENASLFDVITKKYMTNYSPVKFLKWIKRIESKYGVTTDFVSPVHSGVNIYCTMQQYLGEISERGIL